ncbi:MAG: complex I subunit 5 family protein [Candidatus Dormibacteria bacterium]
MSTPLPALGPMVPLMVAAALAGAGAYLPRRLVDLVASLTAVAMLGICLWLAFASSQRPIVYWLGGWKPLPDHVAIGISFTVGPLGAGMAALCCFVVLCAFVYSWHFFEEVKSLFHSLMLCFLAAMVGFCLTGDLFNLFVWFELMSVCGFCLAGYKIEESGPIQGALNFAITNAVGAYMMLLGIGLLYGETGALNLAQISLALRHHGAEGLVLVAMVLILTGFFTKAAVIPYHLWIADAHATAPTPVCIVFSGVMVELGLFGFWRVYETALAGPMQPHLAGVRVLLVLAGCATAVLGSVMCFYQHHLKRLLAFSTMSHSGLFLMGLGTMTPLGLSASSVYVLGHAGVKAALFLCAGVLLHRFQSLDELVLGGRGRGMWLVGGIYLLGGLALAGLPPFGTFAGSRLLGSALQSSGMGWADLIVLGSTALVGAAVFRSGLHVFFGYGKEVYSRFYSAPQGREVEAEMELPRRRVPWMMLVPIVGLMLLGLLAGVLPHLPQAALRAAAVFEDPSLYRAAVLGLHHSATVALGAVPAAAPWDYGRALAAVAGGVGLAVFSLQRARLPRPTELARRVLQPGAERLRALQSGLVTDYVAWMMAGFVAFAAGAAAALR